MPTPEPVQEARVWGNAQWTARVIENEDDDGWAVAMYLVGESEPALVGPWTMGRDKKNPKPLDTTAFHTLVKTAKEFVRRSEQQLHAELNKNITVVVGGSRIRVELSISPAEEGATATLTAENEFGEELARIRVSPAFKLNVASATAWIESDYQRPQ